MVVGGGGDIFLCDICCLAYFVWGGNICLVGMENGGLRGRQAGARQAHSKTCLPCCGEACLAWRKGRKRIGREEEAGDSAALCTCWETHGIPAFPTPGLEGQLKNPSLPLYL